MKVTPKSSKIAKRFQDVTSITTSKVNQGVALATLELHAAAVRGVMKKSYGGLDFRYNPKRMVIASKPGDTPNVDRGVFVKSIKFEVDKNKGYVGSNDVRASWFEFGTKNMEPRPWLGPALKSVQTKIKAIFKDLEVKVD